MKKLLVLSILLSSFIFSCNKDPEPEPELIRAYCYLYHFIPQMSDVIWEIEGYELPEEQAYAVLFPGAVILEAGTDDIEFVVKHPGTSEVLVNQMLQLEQNTYYNVIVCGPADNPTLLVNEIDISYPQAGNVALQALHSIPDQGPIDLYIGDTTQEKRVVTALNYLELTDRFEVSAIDIRTEMTLTAHGDEFSQDSVLLTSDYNDIVSEARYLSVLAHFTHDTTSELTFWLYIL
jgi:hypothetical protein